MRPTFGIPVIHTTSQVRTRRWSNRLKKPPSPHFSTISPLITFKHHHHRQECFNKPDVTSHRRQLVVCAVMPGRPKVSRIRLARRACDSCKVRKIKCSEVPPCEGCSASGIECTFTTRQATRGPKGLREKTIQKINQRTKPATPSSSSSGSGDDETVSHVTDILDIYATRLFPLWPIVDAAELKDSLASGSARPGSSSQRLADAVALATVGQLKLVTDWKGDAQACRRRDVAGGPDAEFANPLDDLRISFFLHVYYENLEGGGNNALLYLREAITHAQILRLEHESTYAKLSEMEQQLYRRVFWLLFVTERY